MGKITFGTSGPRIGLDKLAQDVCGTNGHLLLNARNRKVC